MAQLRGSPSPGPAVRDVWTLWPEERRTGNVSKLSLGLARMRRRGFIKGDGPGVPYYEHEQPHSVDLAGVASACLAHREDTVARWRGLGRTGKAQAVPRRTHSVKVGSPPLAGLCLARHALAAPSESSGLANWLAAGGLATPKRSGVRGTQAHARANPGLDWTLSTLNAQRSDRAGLARPHADPAERGLAGPDLTDRILWR
jgi:hypothetical protein